MTSRKVFLSKKFQKLGKKFMTPGAPTSWLRGQISKFASVVPNQVWRGCYMQNFIKIAQAICQIKKVGQKECVNIF